MKIHTSSQQVCRGVALVIVLAVLVLMSALIIGFMSSVMTERSSTRVNAGIIGARHLADTALNLVISQIREATNGRNPASGSPDEDLTWATQPGVIRTFNGTVTGRKQTGSGAYDQIYRPGNGDFVFKLYSAANMKVSAGLYADASSADLGAEVKFIESYDPTDLDVDKRPELADWVDLNEPFYVPALAGIDKASENLVEPRYPILDPRAKLNASGTYVSDNRYGSVDGFDCKTFRHPKLKYRPRLASGSYKSGQGDPVPLLPMPVRWLYQLKDGSLVPSENGVVKAASKDNPMVGRIAFWTDDETCKLNINTACEGTFWDTPTTSARYESGEVTRSGVLVTNPYNSASLAASQPVRGEYMRYPGHPATTSLSPVLGWLWNIDPNRPTSQFPVPSDFKEAMAALTPFMPVANPRPPHTLGSSTSMGGYQNPDPYIPAVLNQGEFPLLNQPSRYLRASIDELIFDADRFRRTDQLTDGKPSPIGLVVNSKLTPEGIERVRGFLTAVSRAPDLNAHGRPRVTFWPVSAEVDFRTSYDELFAFTSTVNARSQTGRKIPFYFTRWDAKDSQNDYYVEMLRGGAGVRVPNILPFLRGKQNIAMLEYIRFLTTGLKIPGFGGNLGAKYGATPGGARDTEWDQILTEILDYVRTVNLVDTGEGKQSGIYNPYTPRFYARRNADGYNRIERSNDWSGQVVPLTIPAERGSNVILTQGMGRFIVLSDAAIMFQRTTAPGSPGQAAVPAIQAVLILQMSTAMPGFPAIRETFFTKVRELPTQRNRIALEGQQARDLGFSLSPLININNVGSHEVAYGRGFMPTMGFLSQMHFFQTHPSPTTINGAVKNTSYAVTPKTFRHDAPESRTYQRGVTERVYPYLSEPIPILKNSNGNPNDPNNIAANFTWNGGAFEVEIWSGEAPDDPKAQLVQRVQFAFPAQGITFAMVRGNSNAPDQPFTLQQRLDGSLSGRWNTFSNQNNWVVDWSNGDVVRGIEYVGTDANGQRLPLSSQGDLRIASCKQVLGFNDYAHREAGLPNGGRYFDASRRILHSLRCGHGDPVNGFSSSSRGTLVPGGLNRGSKPPILPAGINGVRMFNGLQGDFDRGLSKHMSGAFGNKVDEGNIYFGYDDSSLSGIMPYYRGRAIEETGQSFFSPNRQLPSAVMFGSLPTGVKRGRPWQTLMFRPNRGSADHPGADVAGQPADYHLLDLFHLPVIEPYAISEPFSTAGKVNMNYVMAPFGYAKGDSGTNPDRQNPRSYIRRDTAIRGVLKAVKIMALPTAMPEGGHREAPLDDAATQTRFDIDLDQTLAALESRLKDPQRGLYRTSAEICNVDLVPQQLGKPTNWATFWDTQYAMTGDNMRERPYAHIYPRVTTKSNTFTVHMRCQTIRKAFNSDPQKFEEGKDAIVGEYRGSSIIERFIDPNDPNLANYDYTKQDTTGRLDPYYRFRILSSKQFTAH